MTPQMPRSDESRAARVSFPLRLRSKTNRSSLPRGTEQDTQMKKQSHLRKWKHNSGGPLRLRFSLFAVLTPSFSLRTMRGRGASSALLSYRAGDPVSFNERTFGDVYDRCATTMIKSPWSRKAIRPFIRRDDITAAYQQAEEEPADGSTRKRVPARVRMHQELLLRRNLIADPEYRLPQQTIDYCYLRPEYLSQVNRLLCDSFWPGIGTLSRRIISVVV